jgi:hypothetical protein
MENLEEELIKLEDEDFGRPCFLNDGIKRVTLPGGLVVTEYEIKSHYSEGYQPEREPQDEETWAKAKKYLELICDSNL